MPSEPLDNDLVSVWLDRFVSASTAPDVEAALEGLLACSASIQKEDDDSIFESLIQVLQTSTYKDLELELGSALAAQIVAKWLDAGGKQGEDESWLALKLLDHSLVAALLDVACQSAGSEYGSSTLTRVLALEILERLATQRATSKATQTQLLQANGLVRLAELFSDATDPAVPLSMLQLARTLVEWPSVARNWMFVDVPSVLLEHFVKPYRTTKDGEELTSSTVAAATSTTIQALHILTRMLQQDGSFALLFLETTMNLPLLLPCLDLRLASSYVNPIQKESRIIAKDLGKGVGIINDEDELDTLLQSSVESSNVSIATVSQIPHLPQLTQTEEDVVMAVLSFLAVLMDQESVRVLVWNRHEPLGQMIWELALLTPPPSAPTGEHLEPRKCYPCAMPSVELQAEALLACAAHWNNPKWLALDRVLYLACTGNGALVGHGSPGHTSTQQRKQQERFRLSTCAVHALRKTLTLEAAQDILLESGVVNAESYGGGISTPVPTAVQKLAFTVLENLKRPSNSYSSDSVATLNVSDGTSRPTFLSGATAALLVFVNQSEASKTLLLKVEPQLMPKLVETLQLETDPLVVNIVLHFLVHWIESAPHVLQAFLHLPETVEVVAKLTAARPSQNCPLHPFVWVLLGLAVDQMISNFENDTRGVDAVLEDWGGWTVTTIIEIIKSYGMSRVIQSLYDRSQLEWLAQCRPEERLDHEWHTKVVLRIRKRFVQAVVQQQEQELDTEQDTEESESSHGRAAWATLSTSSRSISALIKQQTIELEDLRLQLQEARKALSAQEQQLVVWKRRVEGSPTQLDDMLNEFTSRTHDLTLQVSQLQEQLASVDQSKIQELQAREEHAAQLTKDLQEARQKIIETTKMNKGLQDELRGLSQAYANLEDEFTQQQVKLLGPESLQPSETSSREHQGDNDHSKEMAALRAENASLRQDVKAAEDWMAMAYERMNSLQKDNMELEEKVKYAKITMQKSFDKRTKQEMVVKETENELQIKTAEVSEGCALSEVTKTDMAETTKRNQDLSNQVVKLTHEKEELTRQIKDLFKLLGSIEEQPSTVSHFQNIKPQEDRKPLEPSIQNDEMISKLGQEITHLKEQLQSQEQEANQAIAGWQQSYNELVQKHQELEKEKESWDAALVKEGLESENEQEITRLKEQLQSQEQEAKQAIAGWQQSYNELVKHDETRAHQKEALVIELEHVVTILKERILRQTLSWNDVVASHPVLLADTHFWQSLKKINETFLILSRQLEIEDRNAVQSLTGWQEQKNDLLFQLQVLSKENDAWQEAFQDLGSPQTMIASMEISLSELIIAFDRRNCEGPGRNQEVTAAESAKEKMKHLEQMLLNHQHDAATAIAEWESSYKELQQRTSELEHSLLLFTNTQGFHQESGDNRTYVPSTFMESELMVQQHGHLEFPAHSVDTRAELQHMEQQLNEQVCEASNVILQWEECYNEATEQWKTLSDHSKSLEITIASLQEQMTNTVAQLEEQIKQKDTECSQMKELFDAHELELARCMETCLLHQQREANCEQKLCSLKQECNSEINHLKSKCKHLEDELSFLVDQADSYEGVLANCDRELSDLQNRVDENQDYEDQLALMKKEKQALASEFQAFKAHLASVEGKMKCMTNEIMNFFINSNPIVHASSSMLEPCTQLEHAISFMLQEFAVHSDRYAELTQELADSKLNFENELALSEYNSSTSNSQVLKLLASERDAQVSIQSLSGQVEAMMTRVQEQEEDARLAICEWELHSRKLQAQVDEKSAMLKNYTDSTTELLSFLSAEFQKMEIVLFVEREDQEALKNQFDASSLASTTHQQWKDLSISWACIKKGIGKLLSNTSELAEPNQWIIEGRSSVVEFPESELEKDKNLPLLGKVEVTGTVEVTDSSFPVIPDPSADLQASSNLRAKLEVLTSQNRRLTEERERLISTVHGLEEGIKGAEESLCLQITRDASDKAVHVVVETLQKQNDELQSMLVTEKLNLNAEKEAHQAACDEVKRLANDLAMALGLSGLPDAKSEIGVRAMNVQEEVHQQESNETEQLKDALSTSLDELMVARSIISKSRDFEANENLKTLHYEQQIVTAKTDARMLGEKLDDMYQTETSKRDALEYRVATLQNENNMLQQRLRVELEKSHGDLHQVSIEKDQLFQALKDSERHKDMLLQATTGAATDDDLFIELTKLRLEKAELLTAASEDSVRLEHCVREARSAGAASSDADTLLERERRVSAEKALQAVSLQLKELQSATRVHGDHLPEKAQVSLLLQDITGLKVMLESVSDENVRLRQQIEEAHVESREEMEALRDACRHAKSRATQLEREGRIEAEIRSEVARLQTKSAAIEALLGQCENGQAEGSGEVHSCPKLVQMSTLIQEQDQMIKESSAAYVSLAAEHERLLAALAELHNVNLTLKQTLVQVAGSSAVDEVLRNSESPTEVFGDSIKLGHAT